MSPFGASGEFFFHSLQDYIATMLVKSNDFLNVLIQIVGFHVCISNTLVKIGGVQVCRTFYAKGQTGQQLLLGAYSSLMKEVNNGTVELHTRTEIEDIVIIDGRCRGVIAKNLVTGKLERYGAHAVCLATGGYGNTYFLSTNAMGCNCTAAVQAYRKGAYFANPCFVQIHPTCIPVHGDKQSKLTLMSESLRNDGRIWVPKNLEDAKKLQRGEIQGRDIPEEDRDYYLERRYPAFGNLVPRDVASPAAKLRNTGLSSRSGAT